MTIPKAGGRAEALVMQAEMIYFQGRWKEASVILTEVKHHNDQLADVSPKDDAEICWMLGMTLLNSQQFAAAIPYLTTAETMPDQRMSNDAMVMQVQCLMQENRLPEAKRGLSSTRRPR